MGIALKAFARRALSRELLAGSGILLLSGGVVGYSQYLEHARDSAQQRVQQASLMQGHAQEQADQARAAHASRITQLQAVQTPLPLQQQRLRASLPAHGQLTVDAHRQHGNWQITHYTLHFPILHEDRFVQWSEGLLQAPGLRIPACTLARSQAAPLGLEATCTVLWYSWQPSWPAALASAPNP